MCTSYNTAHKLPSVTWAVLCVFAGSPSHQSISEWRMQSIARDSEDSTDDEFFDAHGKIICSPLPPAVQKSIHPQHEHSREICTAYIVTKQYSVRKPWFKPPHGSSFLYRHLVTSSQRPQTCSRSEVWVIFHSGLSYSSVCFDVLKCFSRFISALFVLQRTFLTTRRCSPKRSPSGAPTIWWTR